MAKVKSTLTQARLKELLDYDPDTGLFRWRVSLSNFMKVGDVAGGTNGRKCQYIRVKVDGVRYMAHQLAWFYVHGEWAPDEVDHKDRDTLNNRIGNLRPATHGDNQKNKVIAGRSGLKGVCRRKGRKKWIARICSDYRMYPLGKFDTAEEAARAYDEAARRLHGEFARTNYEVSDGGHGQSVHGPGTRIPESSATTTGQSAAG